MKRSVKAAEDRKDVLHVEHPIYAVMPETGFNSEMIYVESEQWVDARSFACRKFGVSGVSIARLGGSIPVRPLPRWQLRWAGHGADNTMEHQCRRLMDERDVGDDGTRVPWIPTRLL